MRGIVPLLLALSACSPDPPAPTPAARYVVGEPYRLGTLWFYPREDLSLVETGLATVAADARPGRQTANGEVHDPTVAMAAHRTLQMPAVVRVANLENGRDLLVRVNDRGPGNPGRLIELSRRAADLLGVAADRPTQVRVTVDGALSRAVAASVPSAEPRGPRVETIPVAAIERESLAPPPGARGVAPAVSRAAARAVTDVLVPAMPVNLPDQSIQGTPAPGRLMVLGSRFSGRDGAARQASRIPGARVEPVAAGRRPDWRVVAGPLASVAEADRMLEQAHRAGVSEARIVVE